MARPRSRTPQLRDRILTAAVAVVEADGASALTTRRVAAEAEASLAALDDLFGGKSGLVDAVANEGFHRLSDELDEAERSADPVRDAQLLAAGFRAFANDRPELFDLMFSRPFDRFSPVVSTLEAARNIRHHFTDRTGACLDVDPSSPQAKDTAIGLVALVQGLSLQERANTLGSTVASADRRWNTAISTFLTGLATER